MLKQNYHLVHIVVLSKKSIKKSIFPHNFPTIHKKELPLP